VEELFDVRPQLFELRIQPFDILHSTFDPINILQLLLEHFAVLTGSQTVNCDGVLYFLVDRVVWCLQVNGVTFRFDCLAAAVESLFKCIDTARQPFSVCCQHESDGLSLVSIAEAIWLICFTDVIFERVECPLNRRSGVNTY